MLGSAACLPVWSYLLQLSRGGGGVDATAGKFIAEAICYLLADDYRDHCNCSRSIVTDADILNVCM